MNMSYILVWLVLVFLLNHAPRNPYILSKSLARLDEYLFDLHAEPFGALSNLFCITCISWLLYVKKFSTSPRPPHEIDSAIELEQLESPTSSFSESSLQTISANDSLELDRLHKLDDTELSHHLQLNYLDNSRLIGHINHNSSYKPYRCWDLAPPILLASSWMLLNFLHSFKAPVSKPKNLVAWIFFVVLQFSIPPIVAFWLYLFHTPGAVKLFSVALGLVNILITLTHFVMPTAPPLFLYLYGQATDPHYNMIYTDGITRQDMKVGTTTYKAVYYAAPNQFASMPSIHAAMTSLIFFFISYYGKYTILKVSALIYLCGQWWCLLYLEHHWRADILIGLGYSIVVWVLVRNSKSGINFLDEKFVKLRLLYDFRGGSTFGMRLFKGTSVQNYFDPLH